MAGLEGLAGRGDGGERDGTVRAARLHLDRAAARIRGRGGLAGALRGLLVGTVAAIAISAALRAGIHPLDEPPSAVIRLELAAALLVAGAAAGAVAGRRRPPLPRIGELWERSLPAPAAAEADLAREVGLASAAAALLAPGRAAPSSFELALLARSLRLPLPARAGLRRAIPGLPPLPLAAAVVVAALAAGLPVEGRGGPEADARGTRGAGSDRADAELGARVDELRRELALREGAALLLDGAPALAPLAAALRGGGPLALAAGTALGAGDRASLRLAAAELRARAERAGEIGDLSRRATEWADRLAMLADGRDDPGDAPPIALVGLEDAAGELAALASEWREGSGASGPVAAAAPEGAGGGLAASEGRDPLADDAPGVEAGSDEAPLDPPPGIPVAPGEVRPEAATVSGAARAVDPREGWLRRSEIEPRWFPVIRAYERRLGESAPGGSER